MALCDLSLNLDLNNNMNVFVNCKQFDTLNINFNIFKSGLAENLKDYKARLKAFKSDQTTLVQEHTGVTISNNVVTVKASEQLTNASGNTIIELQFYNKITGEKKSTYNIILTVYESSINVDGSISKSTYTLLEELEYKLDQATDYFENIEKATNLNNDIKLNITQATTLNATLKDNTDKGTTIDNSLKENIPKATEGNTTLLATIETSKTTKTELDESIKKANDFITANGNITDLATKVDQNTKDIATLSNPNLLINGDFQIWQRGTSFNSKTNFPYTCDRWRLYSNTNDVASISKVDEGAKIKFTANNTETKLIYFFEDDFFKKIKNQKITLTIKFNNATDILSNVRMSGLDTKNATQLHFSKSFTSEKSDVFSITFTALPDLTKNELRVQFSENTLNREVVLSYIKIEIGEKSTPLTPRLYGEELALCQRYYQVRYLDENVIVTDDSQMLKVITLPISMRVTPTSKALTKIYFHQIDDKTPLLIIDENGTFQVSSYGMNACEMALWLMNNASGTVPNIKSGMMGTLNTSNIVNNRLSDVCKISLDAEIY